jgi:DNA polymerase I-like protein with 3'-5' exonuclease and polymerase domains
MSDERDPTEVDEPTGDASSGDALFDVPHGWEQHWQGMPDYEHRDLMPWQTLLVHFRTPEDRRAFSELVGQPLNAKTKFIWHPEAKIEAAADKVWKAKRTATRYPVYIISKGRADTRLTSRCFEWIGVPYHIVVEPQEYDAYAAVIDPAKILQLPFSNLGQGSIPARNWVWEHSIAQGAERHWIFDDNVAGFCRFTNNIKIEVDSGVLLCAIEDFIDRYENVAMAGFNYDYFAPRKQGSKINPITFNTRVYSGILLSNTIEHRWRGRYNEDTDLSLRILKDGLAPGVPGRYATALFNAFLMYKKPTLTMKGGNATELYQGVEAAQVEWETHAAACDRCKQCVDGYGQRVQPCEAGRRILERDGRWRMAESLREQHPDCTTVERKWRRWQHQVDYRSFRDNPLILKPGVNLDELRDEYEMELDAMPPDPEQPKAERPRRRRADEPEPAVRRPSVGLLSFIQGLAAEPAEPAAQAEPEPASISIQPVPDAVPPAGPAEPEGVPAELPDVPEPEPPEGPANALRDALDRYVEQMRERGHHFLTRDGKFFVSNSSQLTTKDRDMIKLNREELIKRAEPWIEPAQQEQTAPTVDQASAPLAAPVSVAAPAALQEEPSEPQDRASKDADAQTGPDSLASSEGSLASESLFAEPRPGASLAEVLGVEPPRYNPDWKPDALPNLSGVDEIVLNFATNGLDWRNGHRPVGLTVATLDGALCRFLPFAFQGGGNLVEENVQDWFIDAMRGKKVTNANTRFELHMSRAWNERTDLEALGCTFSDVMHTAALLDDHRKRFALDVLAQDYLPDQQVVERLDERVHHTYAAWEVANRERYSVLLIGRLVERMYPQLEHEELVNVQRLEDDVIPVTCEMERNGSPLDEEYVERMFEECKARHDALMMKVGTEAGFAFEHSASGWKRLFEHLGLPPSSSYAEDVVEAVDHPLVQKAHFASQLASLNSKTFGAYRKAVQNGVLYYDINQLRGDEGGTVSGRFSIGYVQQVPNHDNHHKVFGDGDVDACKGACWGFPRRAFVAGQGDYLQSDAAQIEFRFLAHLAGNKAILDAYAANPRMSFHKDMWARFKQYKPDMLYTEQKTLNFARQYGARSIKLAVMMGFITKREGEEIRRAKAWNDPRLARIKEIEAVYRKVMPEGEDLLERASHLAKNGCDEFCNDGRFGRKLDKWHRMKLEHRGWVKTLLGRRSRFPHNNKTHIGLNRVIQGSCADVNKRKLVELHRERRHTGFLLRITAHDAALGDARLPETAARVDEVLNAQSFPEVRVPILWETSTGRSWAEAK